MRCGGLVVEFDRFIRGGQRACVGLWGWHERVFAQKVVTVGESDIGLGIVGILDDRLRERVHRLVQAISCSLLPIVTAFEVELLGLAIGGMMSEAGSGGKEGDETVAVALMGTERPLDERSFDEACRGQ